jgi:hypothetical protein
MRQKEGLMVAGPSHEKGDQNKVEVNLNLLLKEDPLLMEIQCIFN